MSNFIEHQLKQFPEKFRQEPRFAELAVVARAITEHKAMQVENPLVLENMIRASLAFTVCFYRNLLAVNVFCQQKKLERGPFSVDEDNTDIYLFSEMALEELADTKIFRSPNGKPAPHYVTMKQAAQEAGVETKQIEDLVATKAVADIGQTCRELGFSEELTEYFLFSYQCSQSFDASFATIGSRELLLSANFRVIVDHLPQAKNFDLYREFLSRHIAADESEHGPLMVQALEQTTDVEKSLDIMIEFYQRRLAVYDACLSTEKTLY